MTTKLILVSHSLCPYVQRAAIALAEKGVAFERVNVDLAKKPNWFLRVSPLGKTPVLLVGDEAIFESNVILEYLEETEPHPLHPVDPLLRAQHRGWMEFGSSILNDIAGLYVAPDETGFTAKAKALRDKFDRLEAHLGSGPFFAGKRFSLVDAAFGPVFRYFDTFDQVADFGIISGQARTDDWRRRLSQRQSVKDAVDSDYASTLEQFLLRKQSHLSSMMASRFERAASTGA